MDRRRVRQAIGIAMVGVGLLQVWLGLQQGNELFALLGATYGLLGGVYFWYEGFDREL